MAADDVKKTAVITPFGLFEFVRMPFGLQNAGQSFQRMMDVILADMPAVFCYMDDILVASPNHATHLQDLRRLLTALQNHGLVLNLEKCLFAKTQVEFLGHIIDDSGARPLVSNVAAVQEFPPPTTVKELQQFLGMVNFYRRFLPRVARLLGPLTDLLKGGHKGSTPICLSPAADAAFRAAKAALCHTATLAHPDASAEISVMTDASESHVGAVLQQRASPSSPWRPLGFYSKKLTDTQKRYSAFDRELWAIFSSIRHFRYMLEGRSFCVFTDHKPLVAALGRKTEPWSAKQQRQLAYIAEYTSDLRHVAGAANVVADTLSRPATTVPAAVSLPPAATSSPSSSSSSSMVAGVETRPVPASNNAAEGSAIDFAAVAEAQRACAETQAAANSQSLKVKIVAVEGVGLLCDTSTGRVRPLVPLPHRRLIFDALHTLAHAGTRATRRMISSRFMWRGMSKDIAAWCRDCQPCHRGKVLKHVKSAVSPIAVPARRFSHLHVDLVGPLPPSQEGYTHLLTIIDRSTRWVEAVPMTSTTAAACADAVVRHWVVRFGLPEVIISDRGPQFTSAIWADLCLLLGISHRLTTAYHPQSNGMVERFHRQLKDALRSRECGAAWVAHLPWVLLGLRTAPKEDSGLSSAELVYGEQLRLPSQPCMGGPTPPFGGASLPPVFQPLQTRIQRTTVEEAIPTELTGATHVYVRRGAVSSLMTPPYEGPYVVRRRRPKTFDIFVGGKLETVSVDRLKLHRGASAVSPAVPPRRGRPLKKNLKSS
jgi:cleavage and polyadenylation specificity factor subunit 1